MSKKHRNVPNPGYFKVQGGAYKDGDAASVAKGAISRQRARIARRAGRKTVLGEAPPEQHAPEPEAPLAPIRVAKPANARSRVERAARTAGERAAAAIEKQRSRKRPAPQRRAAPKAEPQPQVEARTQPEEQAGFVHRMADRAERIVGLAVGAYHLGRAGVEHTFALGRAAVDLWRHRHDDEPSST